MAGLGLEPRPGDAKSSTPHLSATVRGGIEETRWERRGVQTSYFHHWGGEAVLGKEWSAGARLPKKGLRDAQSLCLAGNAAHLFPSIVPSQPPITQPLAFRGLKSSYPFHFLFLSPRHINTVGT